MNVLNHYENVKVTNMLQLPNFYFRVRSKEVNSVSYRPVWPEFVVPILALVQKQGSFVPV